MFNFKGWKHRYFYILGCEKTPTEGWDRFCQKKLPKFPHPLVALVASWVDRRYGILGKKSLESLVAQFGPENRQGKERLVHGFQGLLLMVQKSGVHQLI